MPFAAVVFDVQFSQRQLVVTDILSAVDLYSVEHDLRTVHTHHPNGLVQLVDANDALTKTCKRDNRIVAGEYAQLAEFVDCTHSVCTRASWTP
jgi:hypothetical protein